MKPFKLMLVVLLLAPLVARADTILVRGKEAISGVRVVSETMKEVTYTTRGKSRKTIPASEVIAVLYDRQPVNYRLGVERFSLGDFVNAIARLKPAVSEGEKEQEWVKHYALYFLGRAQLAQGQFRDGATTLKKFLAGAGEHRLVPAATIALAKCQSLDGDHGAAKTTLTNLRGILKKNGVNGLTEMRLGITLGESYLAAGKYVLAAETFKEVAASGARATGPAVELGYTAKALLLRAHLLNKDRPKAALVLGDLRSAFSRDSAHAAAAYRDARAMMLLWGNEGQTPEAKELLEAAFDLSRVRGENFGVVSELPRNCYLLGLIHLKLDGSLSKAKELAKGYFEETRRLYPESREAFLAREELKKM